jgi:hypothetical protein
MLSSTVPNMRPVAALVAGVRCREIEAADIGAIIDLLCVGFIRRDRTYWEAALRQRTAHRTPDGFPRYGFLLDAGEAVVGVLLLISTRMTIARREIVRCNLSTWYVHPDFRLYASLLVSRARKLPAHTFVNTSPAVPTFPVIEAQGFRRFSGGAFAAIPALSGPLTGCKVTAVGAAGMDEPRLPPDELRLLRDHAGFGCVSLCCRSASGDRPFVFRRRHVEGVSLACAHLVFCRAIDDLTRFAGPLGRYLALRGMGWTIVASDVPLAGLVGRLYAGRFPMYYAGTICPRPGDLAYTEGALFGF